MADRDLLNKPMPLVIPEDRDHTKRSIPAPTLGKLGVQVRAPIIGAEADAPTIATEAAAPQGPRKPTTRGREPVESGRNRGSEAGQAKRPAVIVQPEAAFKAAYFNRDVGSTAGPNLRARPMAALRGEEGATDLKRVVLPPPSGSDAPAPEQLGGALTRMLPVVDAQQPLGAPSLQGLVGQLSAFTQEAGMTQEKLLQRMAELEALVAVREQALMRMAQLTPAHLQRARTITQAILAQGEDLAQGPNLVEEADQLLAEGHSIAQGLHARLKKVMGVKR